jgi:hypothetical protein
MGYLSLCSLPASNGSRIFFSLASFIELFVSEPSQSCHANFTSSLSQQILVYSILTLRLHHPPAVRLMDTSSSRASTPSAGSASRTSSPPLPSSAISTSTNTSASSTAPSFSHPRTTLEPPDLLDSLSLSTAPPPIPLRTWHAAGPVFGHPSLPLRPAIFAPSDGDARQQQQDEEEDDNAMDWTPTASPVRPSGLVPPRTAVQAQTNVAPASDATTGLETLLERTNIDSSEPSYAAGAGRRRRTTKTGWSWGWVYALSLVPVIGMVYYQVSGAGFLALLS